MQSPRIPDRAPSPGASLVLLLFLGSCSATPEEPRPSEAQPAVVPSEEYAREGFEVFEVDGRLWIFEAGSEHLGEFHAQGGLEKYVSLPASGPRGETIKTPERDVALAYLASRRGFATRIHGGLVWVFPEQSEELVAFDAGFEPTKTVTLPAAGPLRTSLRALDRETVFTYLAQRPGFAVRYLDGRLWVFREGSAALAAFDEGGEPKKHVTFPSAGPRGLTVRAVEREVIVGYLVAAPGFVTIPTEEEHVWVFAEESPALATFLERGELVPHVTRASAGPRGMTLKAADDETLDRYLRVRSL